MLFQAHDNFQDHLIIDELHYIKSLQPRTSTERDLKLKVMVHFL